MDSPYVAKLLSLHRRGVATTPEVANSLLVGMIADDSRDDELPSFVAGLPDEVRQKLKDLLREIQAAEYRWKPFMLGPGGSVLDSESEDSARLRRLCSALEIAQPAPARDTERGRSDGA